MLKEFVMQDCKPNKRPMIKGLWLVVGMGMKEVEVAHCEVMVGKFICLINSKLDISFVVGEASSFMVGPQ